MYRRQFSFDSNYRGLVSNDIQYTLAPLEEYETWCKEYIEALSPYGKGTAKKSLLNQPKKLRDIVHALKRGASMKDLKPRYGDVGHAISKLPERLK